MGPIRSRAVVLLAGVIVCCAAGAGLLGADDAPNPPVYAFSGPQHPPGTPPRQ